MVAAAGCGCGCSCGCDCDCIVCEEDPCITCKLSDMTRDVTGENGSGKLQ